MTTLHEIRDNNMLVSWGQYPSKALALSVAERIRATLPGLRLAVETMHHVGADTLAPLYTVEEV